MKILPVNQTQSQQSFKGLWGKTDSSAYSSDTVSNTVIVKHYYPFKDEPKEAVDKIVRENSFRFEAGWLEANGITTYNDTSVCVHTLPFTKNEYNAYMSQKLIEGVNREPYTSIDKYLKENGLREHLNRNKISKWKLNGLIAKAIYPKNPAKRVFYQLTHKIKL